MDRDTNWKDGVGPHRKPLFDKAWRVEEPNLFGTDEYFRLCRKIGCEPYICTNAGTGTAEEMSDWVEYCNLESEGQYAKWRIENGNAKPYQVKYWSIGNENYGRWEIGAKSAEEWGSASGFLRNSPDIGILFSCVCSVGMCINALHGFHLRKNFSTFPSSCMFPLSARMAPDLYAVAYTVLPRSFSTRRMDSSCSRAAS